MIQFGLKSLCICVLWISTWLALNLTPWSIYAMPAPAAEFRVVGWPWPYYIVSYYEFDDFSGMDFSEVRIIDHYCSHGSNGDNLGVPYGLNAIKNIGVFFAASALLLVFVVLLRRNRNRVPQKNSDTSP